MLIINPISKFHKNRGLIEGNMTNTASTQNVFHVIVTTGLKLGHLCAEIEKCNMESYTPITQHTS